MRKLLCGALCALFLASGLDAFADVYAVPKNPAVFIGQSTDTKPTTGLNPGDLFYESDTDQTFMWVGPPNTGGDSADWVLWGGGASIREMPNPSCHSTALGICESGSGGTAYFDDNVANASFQVTTGASRLVRFTLGGDTATTVTFYDDSDGTCNSNQRTPTFTSPSATIPGIYEIGMDFTNGICMLTAGGAGTAEVGVVTLP